MLSGIGPAEHLRYHGIPVRVNLAVGKSLQSHVGTGEIQFTVREPVAYNVYRYIQNPGKYILPYFTRRGEGPLASPAGVDVIGNVRTGLDNSTRFNHFKLVFRPDLRDVSTLAVSEYYSPNLTSFAIKLLIMTTGILAMDRGKLTPALTLIREPLVWLMLG